MGIYWGLCRDCLFDKLASLSIHKIYKMTREQAGDIIKQHGISDKVVILGYRSADSQYGRYDDIAGILTPTGYVEFKFNTLPSRWDKRIAKLMPGVYRYKKGLHGIHHLNFAQRKDGSYVFPGDKEIFDWLQA